MQLTECCLLIREIKKKKKLKNLKAIYTTSHEKSKNIFFPVVNFLSHPSFFAVQFSHTHPPPHPLHHLLSGLQHAAQIIVHWYDLRFLSIANIFQLGRSSDSTFDSFRGMLNVVYIYTLQ